MKFTDGLLLLTGCNFSVNTGITVAAFSMSGTPLHLKTSRQQNDGSSSSLYSSSTDDAVVDVAYTTDYGTPTETVLEVAKKLKEDYGTFLYDASAKTELKKVVQDLEETVTEETAATADAIIGDWTLLCTTTTSGKAKDGFDTSQIPAFLFDTDVGPLSLLRDAGNKYIRIVQRIRADFDENGGTFINRVDNVIESSPPDSIQDIVASLPDIVSDALNINPFQVTASKVILKHDATIEPNTNPLKTNINLSGIILNVAGKSKKLNPDGDDIFGVNIPSLEQFKTNAGSFETTYVDDTLRISRGKGDGLSDQLRVFVRDPIAPTPTESTTNTDDDDAE